MEERQVMVPPPETKRHFSFCANLFRSATQSTGLLPGLERFGGAPVGLSGEVSIVKVGELKVLRLWGNPMIDW